VDGVEEMQAAVGRVGGEGCDDILLWRRGSEEVEAVEGGRAPVFGGIMVVEIFGCVGLCVEVHSLLDTNS
jgi:hypothetical protein